MSCPIKVNSNTIELIVHTSCYCILDLLCVLHVNWKPCKVNMDLTKTLNFLN